MKARRFLSNLLISVGLALIAATIAMTAWALHTSPVIMKEVNVESYVQAMMSAVSRGDYSEAATYLYGTPSLGEPPADGNPAVDLLWQAYRQNISWNFPEPSFTTDSGIALNVHFTTMRISEVLSGLDQRAQALMDRRMSAAKSEDLFDASGELRRDVIDAILCDAVAQALEDGEYLYESTVTVSFVNEDGRWWIVPDTALLNVISGFGSN